jgi:hypothetical protein
MKLDDLARAASRDVRTNSRSMPVVPIATVRRRRMVTTLVPMLTAVAAFVAVAVVLRPSEAPDVIDQTTTTTETTIEPPAGVSEVAVTEEAIAGAAERTDTITNLTAPGCCVDVGPDGAVLVVQGDEVIDVTGTRLAVGLGGLEPVAIAALDDGVLVAGDELRRYDSGGGERWSLPIEAPAETVGGVAIDDEGVVWLGRSDRLPDESGFAELQWTPAATLDGAPVTDDRRTGYRPLPGGLGVQVTGESVEVVDAEGTGVRWTMPAGVTVLAADPFLDGLLVAATTQTTGALGPTLGLWLRPGQEPTVFVFPHYWQDTTGSPRTISVGGGTLAGLGSNPDGALLATVSIDDLVPLPPLDLTGVRWVRGGFDRVTADDGSVLARLQSTTPQSRTAAWDGGTGLVVIGDGELRWIRPDGETTVDVEVDLTTVGIVDAALVGDRHVVGLVEPGDGAPRWFELETGTEVDSPAEGRTLDGATFTAQGRTATIALPDWSEVERDESGAPIPPFDLPVVVVTGAGGEVRLPVGTEQRPHATIHDFDGRRLVVAIAPQEPALPPQTVYIFDLECPTCTRVIETPGFDWFDLVGTEVTTGGLQQPDVP